MSAAHNRLTLLLCTFAVAACARDIPTTPSSLTQHSGASKRLVRPIAPNAVKYRDRGARPAGSRSGLAAVEVRALMAKDGNTTVEATTGTFDGGSAAGVIEKAQLKLLDAHYPAINEKPAASTWSHEIGGIVPGESVQVQANVSGIDATRMDVVTAVTSVQRRPDIQVGKANVASSGLVGVPVVINATLRELNGEVGARTTCVLMVDDHNSDQATGIWVDAGDAVTCQFSHAFVTAGTHTVQVQALSVAPGDWDYDNNHGAASTIEIQPAGNPVAAGVASIVLDNMSSDYRTTRGGAWPIDNLDHTETNHTNVMMDGQMNSPSAAFDRVEARGTSGGVETYSETLQLALSYQDESVYGWYRCYEYYSELNALAQACTSYFLGVYETYFSYWRASGTITYYGNVNYCNTVGCDVYSYTGDESPSWQPAIPFDPTKEAGLEVAFVEANGQRWVASSRMTFQDYSDLMNDSGCFNHRDGLGQVCWTLRSTGTLYEGIGSW